MPERLYRWFEPRATWSFVVILLIAFIFSAQAFSWRQKQLGENQTLDMQYAGYNPPKVAEIFGRYNEEQLKLYAYTELTLDFVFPFIYGLLLILLTIHIFSKEKAEYLILLPIVGGFADLCENSLITYMALSFDGTAPPIAWLASVFTITKVILVSAGTIALFFGAAFSFIKGVRV